MCTRQWCKLWENRIRENILRSPRVDRFCRSPSQMLDAKCMRQKSQRTVTYTKYIQFAIDNAKSCKRVLDRVKSLVTEKNNDLCSIHLQQINIRFSGKLDMASERASAEKWQNKNRVICEARMLELKSLTIENDNLFRPIRIVQNGGHLSLNLRASCISNP